jgi:type III secretion system chaperone SycN
VTASAEILTEFGRSLGIEVADPERGTVRLEFEKRGVLSLESFPGILLVCLVREIEPGEDVVPIFRKALEACHYRQGLPFVVHPGLSGDSGLVFVIRLPKEGLSLPTLEAALETLTSLHDSVRS